MALVYVRRLCCRLPPNLTCIPAAPHRVLLTALVVAAKMTHDRALKVNVWARYSALFPAQQVHRMECQFLALLEYQLCIDEPELLSASRAFMLNAGYYQEAVPTMLQRSWSTTDLDLFLHPIDATSRTEHRFSQTNTTLLEDQDDQPINIKPSFSRSVGLYRMGPQLAFLSSPLWPTELPKKKMFELGLGPPLIVVPSTAPPYWSPYSSEPSTNTLGSPLVVYSRPTSANWPMTPPGLLTTHNNDSSGSSPTENTIITPVHDPSLGHPHPLNDPTTNCDEEHTSMLINNRPLPITTLETLGCASRNSGSSTKTRTSFLPLRSLGDRFGHRDVP